MHNLTHCPLSGLAVERRSGSPGGPQAFTLPAGLGIVDASVEPFGEKPDRVGHAQDDEFPVDQRQQRIRVVTSGYWHILSQPEGVELIHPVVVMRIGAAVI